ncbi:MAG: putative 3-oxoacyl-[acyl-carrier-protein] reductase [Acidimicrobiales bacterium]|nr:putative 3-oxoacyl-[acyl-carrier-protein] reductase [Acidimicrobiales bacterium]
MSTTIRRARAPHPEHTASIHIDFLSAPGMTEPANPSLDGRVVAISGGNGGIGLGLARAAAAAGAAVMIWGRNVDKNAAAAASLGAAGGSAASVACDVGDADAVDDAIRATLERFGRIDGFVANAAMPGTDVAFLDMPSVDWRELIDMNLTSVFVSLQHVARQMVAQGEPGALVAISSIITHYGAPGKSHYAAAKSGVDSLVRTIAAELAPQRIRCNALAPGWTETELIESGFGTTAGPGALEKAIVRRTPARRWGTPDDYGRAAVMLLDPTLSFHTGDVMTIDGGYTIS